MHMTPKLTDEMREAIKHHQGTPVYLVDADTNAEYVLLPADVYQKVRTLFEDDDVDIRETYAAQFGALDSPECWNAPGMELYEDYDAHKPPS